MSDFSKPLNVNKSLLVGEYITSENDAYYAIMQSTGNFCLYQGSGPADQQKLIWALNDEGGVKSFPPLGAYFAVMPQSGDFSICRGSSPADLLSVIWALDQGGGVPPLPPAGAYFAVMQNDGSFCVYQGSPANPGALLWTTGPAQKGSSITNRQLLRSGDYMIADNRAFYAIMQTDGNFCIYQGSGPSDQQRLIWAINQTNPVPHLYAPSFATVQTDSKFCVYRGSGPSDQQNLVWASSQISSQPSASAFAQLDNTGSLSAYQGSPAQPGKRFWQLDSGVGTIYAISNTGSLKWYRDMVNNGTSSWAPNSGQTISSNPPISWTNYKSVFAADGGVLYAVAWDGKMQWFKDMANNGTSSWAAKSGATVKGPVSGFLNWANYNLFAGDGGVLYAIQSDGSLFWFKNMANNGAEQWDTNSNRAISGPTTGSPAINWASYKSVFAGDGGVLYAITNSGDLLWYKDLNNNGTTAKWADNSGKTISGPTSSPAVNWASYKSVFAGDGGVLYAITTTGNLLWYKDVIANDGSHTWASHSGSTIGHGGWASYQSVFASGGGVLYAITSNGNLLWYKDAANNGTEQWAANSRSIISSSPPLSWASYKSVFAGSGGVLYAITNTDELLWFKDVANNGTSSWDARSGTIISGPFCNSVFWASYKSVFAGSGGVLYAIAGNGDLLWFKDVANNGTSSWDTKSGTPIDGSYGALGHNWSNFRSVFAGDGGVLYAITDKDELLWFKDVANNGTMQWAQNSGNMIDHTDWAEYLSVSTGNGGVLYAITTAGNLLWYKDLNNNGTTARWDDNSKHAISGPTSSSAVNWANFQSVSAGDGGVLYALTTAGNLQWYKDVANNGTSSWDANSGKIIASVPPISWGSYKRVFAGDGGGLYALTAADNLQWYKDVANNGTSSWDANSGIIIDGPTIGRNPFLSLNYSVFAGDGGVLYTITAAGDLLWYKDVVASDGTHSYDAHSNNVISGLNSNPPINWATYKSVFAGNGGVLYAITTAGDLLWFKDVVANDGTHSWDAHSGSVIGHGGWASFLNVFAGDGGVLYAITTAGNLLWYKDVVKSDGTHSWATNSGHVIGQGGWASFLNVFAGGVNVIIRM